MGVCTASGYCLRSAENDPWSTVLVVLLYLTLKWLDGIMSTG